MRLVDIIWSGSVATITAVAGMKGRRLVSEHLWIDVKGTYGLRRHGVTVTSCAASSICASPARKAVRGQDFLRRTGRDAGKAWLAAG